MHVPDQMLVTGNWSDHYGQGQFVFTVVMTQELEFIYLFAAELKGTFNFHADKRIKHVLSDLGLHTREWYIWDVTTRSYTQKNSQKRQIFLIIE